MTAKAYYNDIDPYAAQWLRNLIAAGHIAPGDVDERSITEVQPDDLKGYTQCHFFAGIGGWSYALRLAGWPDDRPVWTGSCPCQPFSSAARGRVVRSSDDRHLWPVWFRLIDKCSPDVVFGEQVASATDWLDEVCSDMERIDYEFGAIISPAFVFGADHARERIYFKSNPDEHRKPGVRFNAEASRVSWARGEPRELAHAYGVSGRVGRLRAYGNAIVPQVGAAFIQASMT
jgi:DNA (cytosine-5)-methyltransferase 1